ncbi:MAG TPA: radical SAM protein [Syntrophorhabdaceae bacterium]|nr:radical SAM protein [Syntrophorhabdaceae bacterium]
MKVFLFNSLNIFPLNIITLFPEEAPPFQVMPPLGLFSLAGSIKHMSGCATRIIDLNHEASLLDDAPGELFPGLYRKVREIISAAAPGNGRFLAGFQTLCTSHHAALYLARRIKEDYPESVTLFGGPQSSAVAGITMELFPFVDYVLSGEADLTFPLFVEALLGERPRVSVGGLHYRDGTGKVMSTAAAPLPDDLDALPLPDYDCYPYPVPGLLVEAGRGCPNNCSFCFTGKFFSRKCRYKSAGRIEKELEMLKAKFTTLGTVSFQHDNLFGSTGEARDLCRSLAAMTKKLDFDWNCFIRLDGLNDEDIGGLLKDSGCNKIFIGIESGSEVVQKKIRKYRNVARAYDIIPRLCGEGLELDLGYMIEFPEETPDDVEKTMRLVAFSRLFNVNYQINPLMIYSGTDIFNECREGLVYDPDRDTTDYNERFFSSPETHAMFRLSPEIFSVFYSFPLKHDEIKGLATLSHFITRSFVHTCLAIIFWSARTRRIVDICMELKPHWSLDRARFMEYFERWVFEGFSDCRPILDIFRYEKDCFDCVLTGKYTLDTVSDGPAVPGDLAGLKAVPGDRVVAGRYATTPPMVSDTFKKALAEGTPAPGVEPDESDHVYFMKGIVRKEERSFNIEVYRYPGMAERMFDSFTRHDRPVSESIDELAKDTAYHEVLPWLFLFFERGLIAFVPAQGQQDKTAGEDV